MFQSSFQSVFAALRFGNAAPCLFLQLVCPLLSGTLHVPGSLLQPHFGISYRILVRARGHIRVPPALQE